MRRGKQPPPPPKFPMVRAWQEDVVYHEGDVVAFAGACYQAAKVRRVHRARRTGFASLRGATVSLCVAPITTMSNIAAWMSPSSTARASLR
jgi:hypothetical protein